MAPIKIFVVFRRLFWYASQLTLCYIYRDLTWFLSGYFMILPGMLFKGTVMAAVEFSKILIKIIRRRNFVGFLTKYTKIGTTLHVIIIVECWNYPINIIRYRQVKIDYKRTSPSKQRGSHTKINKSNITRIKNFYNILHKYLPFPINK